MIAEKMGPTSKETTLRSYARTRWRPSPTAWELLERYAPANLRQ